ncbi:MAG: T9SS type A sorting domain-containing protein, partial [Saprospiraceae bacterium]|nr:T9SS type A sorting domain-containing protein [Saprospiraceae bacterium]
SGNVAGIGFTKNNNVVWSGVDMWYYGWKNKIGFANMQDSTVSEITGLPDYLVQTGQQVSKIVTTTNGTMFLHSGSSTGATQIGIYRSFDGVNWEYFNNGIIGGNNNLSQGSLAVDGNKVFMATSDGKVWMFDAENTTPTNQYSTDNIICYPSPTTNRLTIQNVDKPIDYWIVGLNGKVVKNGKLDLTPAYIDLQSVSKGIYILKLQNSTLNITRKFVKE